MDQLSSNREGGFLLCGVEFGQGLGDQIIQSPITQNCQETIKQLAHRRFGAQVVGGSKFELSPQGMGFVLCQDTVAGNGSQSDGGKRFGGVHGLWCTHTHLSKSATICHPVRFMPFGARVTLAAGVLTLLLAAANVFTAAAIDPSLQRAEVLAGMAAIGLMLVAVLWTRAQPLAPSAVALPGTQVLQIAPSLSEKARNELAWGSHLLLTATSAATILVAWNGLVVLRRGLALQDEEGDQDRIAGSERFVPGAICQRARQQGRLVSLVKTALYPGRFEFDPVLPDLPSVMVYPLGQRGWVVLGGWSERCFSRSDERWFSGWCERLRTTLETTEVDAPGLNLTHP